MLELTRRVPGLRERAACQRPPYAVEAVFDAKGHLIYAARGRTNSRSSVRPSRISSPALLKPVLKYGTGAGAVTTGAGFSGGGQDRHHAGLTRTRTSSATRRASFAACGSASTIRRASALTGAHGGAAGVGTVSCSTLRRRQFPPFPVPAGITMATIDPRIGRSRDDGVPANRHRSVPDRHRADADVSVARRHDAAADFGGRSGSEYGDAATAGCRNGSWSGSNPGDQRSPRRPGKFLRFALQSLSGGAGTPSSVSLSQRVYERSRRIPREEGPFTNGPYRKVFCSRGRS